MTRKKYVYMILYCSLIVSGITALLLFVAFIFYLGFINFLSLFLSFNDFDPRDYLTIYLTILLFITTLFSLFFIKDLKNYFKKKLNYMTRWQDLNNLFFKTLDTQNLPKNLYYHIISMKDFEKILEMKLVDYELHYGEHPMIKDNKYAGEGGILYAYNKTILEKYPPDDIEEELKPLRFKNIDKIRKTNGWILNINIEKKIVSITKTQENCIINNDIHYFIKKTNPHKKEIILNKWREFFCNKCKRNKIKINSYTKINSRNR